MSVEFILSGVSLLPLMQWIAEQQASIALRESLYVWPLIESTHVLTLALFVGSTAMMDLRLLGVLLRRRPGLGVHGRLLPWTRAGFALMAVSGLLLFYATPVRNYQNVFFRIKVILLVAGRPQRLAVPLAHPPPGHRMGPTRRRRGRRGSPPSCPWPPGPRSWWPAG